ncbi:MAG: pyridoxal phosphate-dependent aminotransferase [Phycisphaerae bacterium]
MRSVTEFVSDRARAIDASGVRKVFDLAAKLKDPINLSIGLPDFDVPDAAKLAAKNAIDAGRNRYTPTQGIAELRAPLKAAMDAEFGRDVGDLFVCSGVSGGLMLTLMAMLNPGDEAVYLDPYFVMYRHLCTLAGVKGVPVDTYPDFRLNPEKLEAAITPRTRLLMLNSPSNPTGVVMSEQEIRDAVDIAKKHDLFILSDEIYDPFYYNHPIEAAERTGLYSPAQVYDRTIVLRGFSKSYAMTGWRLGWAAGPTEIIQQMTKLQQYTFVCAPAPFQHAAVAALSVRVDDHIAAYRKKRDLVISRLSSKFEIVQPEGAFYLFPKAPAGMTATEFCTQAVKRNVLTIPGSVFSARDTHFRISYATTDEKLAEGCDVLNALAG